MDSHQRRILHREMERLGMSPKNVLRSNSRENSEKQFSIVGWIEGAGIGSIGIGGLGLVTISFWWGVGFVYAGLLALFISLFFQRFSTKWIGILALLFLGVVFSWGMVFRSAPLEVLTNILANDYPSGSVLGGISWRPDVTYMRLTLNNETNFDFTDLDVTIEPDVSVVAIGQISTVSGVSFHGDVTKETVEVGTVFMHEPSVAQKEPDGKNIEIPLRQLSTPQYRITCPKILRHSSVDLVIGVAEVDQKNSSQPLAFIKEQNFPGAPSRTVIMGPLNPSAVVNYAKKKPAILRVSGAYTAFFKPREVKENLQLQ